MTLVFAIKAKNAWILASDTLASTPVYLELQSDNQMVDVEEKFRISGNLVIAGAGHPNDILRLLDLLSEQKCKTIQECNDYLKDTLRRFEFDGGREQAPTLILISQQDQECAVLNCDRMRINPNAGISPVVDYGIIGAGQYSNELASVKAEMMRYLDEDVTEENAKEVGKQCARMIGTLWKGLQGDLLKTTGHPAIFGCDVNIIWADSIKRLKIYPREYYVRD